MKLIAPNKLETPAKCNEKIVKSTDAPEWDWILAKGGYTVQPVPAPDSAKEPTNNNINEGGNNQKEILLSLGNQFSIRNLLHIWTMSSSNFSRVRAKRR